MYHLGLALGAATAAALMALLQPEWAALGLAAVAIGMSAYSIRRSKNTADDLKSHVLDRQTKVLEEWPEPHPDED